MKEQIKIRRKWLIDPDTKVETSKKFKQRYQDEEEQDWKQYQGLVVTDKILEEIESREDDKEPK